MPPLIRNPSVRRGRVAFCALVLSALAWAPCGRAEEVAAAPYGISQGLIGELQNLRQQAADWYSRDLFRAMEFLGDLTDRIEAMRPQLGLVNEDTRAFFARWTPAYKELARLQAGLNQPEAALLNIERAKARTLLDQVKLRDVEDWARLSPEDRQALRQAEEAVGAMRAGTSPEAADLRAKKAHEYANLIQQMGDKYTDFMARVRGDAPNLDALRMALPEDAIYLSIAHEANVMLVVGLTREGSLARIRPEGPHWKQTALAFHKALSRHNGLNLLRREGWSVVPSGRGYALSNAEELQHRGVKSLETLADWFGEHLLEPILDQFPGKRRLIISPDGPFYMLPFEAMRMNGRWLVEDYDISYTVSATALLLSKERQERYARMKDRLPLLAVGGGEYQAMRKLSPNVTMDTRLEQHHGEARRVIQDQGRIFLKMGDAPPPMEQAYAKKKSTFENLPASEREIRKVAELFPGAHLLQGSRASERSLVDLDHSGDLARYRYLLLSAHGITNTSNPWLSAIVLAQNGGGLEDGYVTAAEWQRFRLHSDLTVLAACESGAGLIQHGEGILGLPYALTLAGSANVAQTLWAVEDQSTASLVTGLFRRISGGEPLTRALARSKRELFAQFGAENPYFWAPLVMYGY